MIWVYISIAVFLSWLVCEKRVAWYHYIWMLLPIEMYGVNAAGATIKPYMLYGFAIVAYSIIKNRGMKFPQTVLIIAVLLLLSDVINGFILTSIMQHLMFLMILFIALEYLMLQKKTIDLEGISKITIATTIGYGAVFAGINFLFNRGIVLPDVFTADRYSTGMIYSSIEGFDKFSNRLRGFCIDPNGVVTTLIPGATFALANIMYKKKDKVNMVKNWIAVIVFFIVVGYTGSRMAFLSSIIMATIMFFVGYKQTEHKAQWIFGGLLATFILMLFAIINEGQFFIGLYENVETFFSSSASLTAHAGRLTIWKHNFNYLVNNDKLLTGVGQNQILNYSVSGKPCHNTWLEWICGTGLIIGTVINLWFIFAHRAIKKKCIEAGVDYLHDYFPIILAYWIVLIAITSIDNITNSIMLFFMVLFRYGCVERLNVKISEENKNG